ncbi:MAG: tetratricopeptide repeat protein, partial [Candidatus Omnitrophica bacterium]|nr:tetratricopeptide repeat protein [Candidatus Omnitrophota bacterium]
LVILINIQHIQWRKIFSPVLLKKRRWKYFGSLVFKAILIGWMINTGLGLSSHGYFSFETMSRKSEFGGVTQKNYPTRAADFLVKNKIRGNFFNDFNSGAYLLGRAHPDIRVYMDGRTEVYGADYFKTYLQIWRGNEPLFQEHVAKYNITGAFLNSIQKPAPARLIRHLYHNPEWALVYFDFDAAIFLRDIPQNRAWIEQFAIDLNAYETPKIDIVPIATKRIVPYEHVQRAQALLGMGIMDKAQAEAFEALRILPNDAAALKVLGKVAVVEGNYTKAFAILRNCLLVNGRDNEVRYYFGVSLFHLGQLDQAEAQAQRILAKNPRNTKALVLAALIYAKKGEPGIARQLWPRQDGEMFTVAETVQEINPEKELLAILEL